MSEDFVPEFKYIVKTYARLVASQDITLLPRDPRFSSDTGIVPPLHATASKCRNSAIRREAINQLSSSPRQDGMWDGVLSARALASSLRGGWSETASIARDTSSGLVGLSQPTASCGGYAIGWERGRRISEVVDEVRREHEIYGPGAQRHATLSTSNTRGSGNGISNAQGKGARETKRSKTTDQVNERGRLGRAVPDENRVQLTAVDFHIPTIKIPTTRTPNRTGAHADSVHLSGRKKRGTQMLFSTKENLAELAGRQDGEETAGQGAAQRSLKVESKQDNCISLIPTVHITSDM
ncbi:transcription factor Cys [Marssonina coronariae]|uniref:Transcription factor Cys n=1 Tax=Diplocarpon coronariae TaxID=2795749 RepID=A0A218ZC71_9HELO|nr:transcription factor Cys [Marssonina coronariae]